MVEEERLNSEAPKVPHILSLEEIKIDHSLQNLSGTMSF